MTTINQVLSQAEQAVDRIKLQRQAMNLKSGLYLTIFGAYMASLPASFGISMVKRTPIFYSVALPIWVVSFIPFSKIGTLGSILKNDSRRLGVNLRRHEKHVEQAKHWLHLSEPERANEDPLVLIKDHESALHADSMFEFDHTMTLKRIYEHAL